MGLRYFGSKLTSGHEIVVLVEQKHFDFCESVGSGQTVIHLFLVKVAWMRAELFPGHRVIVKMIHLCHIKSTGWVVVTILTIAALQSDHLTLLSQVLSYFLIRVLVLGSTEAFVVIAGAFPAFSMPSEFCNSVDLDFLESSTSMTDLYPVYNV